MTTSDKSGRDTRFKRGEPSANPLGRPKGRFTFAGLIKKALAADPERAQRIVEEFLCILERGAKRGQVDAFRIALDRIDGPVKQLLEAQVHREKTIRIVGGTKRDTSEPLAEG